MKTVLKKEGVVRVDIMTITPDSPFSESHVKMI